MTAVSAFPPVGAAQGSRESGCRCAVWECATPPSRLWSPSPGHGSRSVAPVAWPSARPRPSPGQAPSGPGPGLDFKLHQTLGGETDHFPQQVCVCALFKHRAKRHHLVGHCGHPLVGFSCGDQTLTLRTTMTAPPWIGRPPAPAMGALPAGGLSTAPTPPHGTRSSAIHLRRSCIDLVAFGRAANRLHHVLWRTPRHASQLAGKPADTEQIIGTVNPDRSWG